MTLEDLRYPAALSKNLSPHVFRGVSESQREFLRLFPSAPFRHLRDPSGWPISRGRFERPPAGVAKWQTR